jgi:predicted dehydrogenase
MIKWGIIGCGDVTEVKSGPAFNKVPNSSLVAVMRRDAVKAADYAQRHGVPKWYGDADELINDPDINAIYIATPPRYHEAYTIAALQAGKDVYVEKPMTLTSASAHNMQAAAIASGKKLTVAHYRRGLQLFLQVKAAIDTGVIGEIRFVNLQMLQPHESDLITKTADNWRVNPEISGGGLFFDLAPHQIDLMLYFFGKAKSYNGFSDNQGGYYPASDIVTGNIQFENGVLFNGIWCFTVPQEVRKDEVEIIGSKGRIRFSVFGTNFYQLEKDGQTDTITCYVPPHIQQPMIEWVVEYFSNKRTNPCSAEVGIAVMQILETLDRL